jgi:single-stranded DNA-binding protein
MNKSDGVRSVVCRDKLAETTGRYVEKGAPLYVKGRLHYRSYRDSADQECCVVEVVAGDLQFLGRRGDRLAPASIPATRRGASRVRTGSTAS